MPKILEIRDKRSSLFISVSGSLETLTEHQSIIFLHFLYLLKCPKYKNIRFLLRESFHSGDRPMGSRYF